MSDEKTVEVTESEARAKLLAIDLQKKADFDRELGDLCRKYGFSFGADVVVTNDGRLAARVTLVKANVEMGLNALRE